MGVRTAVLVAAFLAAGAAPGLAEPPEGKPLRLIGSAPTAKDPAPRRFVIDAWAKPGDGDFQTSLEGWFAGLGGEGAPTGSIEGSCVEKRCTLSVDVEGGTFALVGDFGEAAAPVSARFAVKDDYGKALQQGAVTLTPLTAAGASGLGPLAAPGAVDAAELDDLLMWNGVSGSFGGREPGELPTGFQRENLAEWQAAHARPGTGLIFAADLAQLRAEAAAARKTAGWISLGDKAHGWTGFYPATLLPRATQSGTERRFASADGRASVVFAVDSPLSEAEFDAFLERLTADREGRSSVSYTRVNRDLEIRYEEKGEVVAAAYHARDGGMARMVFNYPADQSEQWSRYEALLQRALVVEDDLKP